MAIKIPSSKIYDNQHTLYKNFIDKVDAKESYLDFKKTFDTTVLSYQQDFAEMNDSIFKSETLENRFGADGNVSVCRYVNATLTLLSDSESTPIIDDNGKKTIVGVKGEGNNSEEVSSSFSGLYIEKLYYNVDGLITTSSFSVPTEEELRKIIQIEPTIIEKDISEVPYELGFEPNTAAGETNVNFGDLETLWVGTPNGNVTGEIKNKRVSATVRTGFGEYVSNSGYKWEGITYKEYIPKSYTFSIRGDIEEYESKNITKTFGDGSDYYEMPSNELFQATTKISSVPITEINANNLIKDFRNGKETYELLCSVKEYYNEDGTLAISTKGEVGGKTKMMFDIGDEVIPYKSTAAGDKPISYKKDGKTHKTFIVVGVTPIFDGAVWQRLNLIEKTIENITVQSPEIKEEDYIDTGNIDSPFVVTKENKYYLGDSVGRVFYNNKEITSSTTFIEYLTVGQTTASVMVLLKDGNLFLSITAGGSTKTEFPSKSYEFILS